MKSKLILVVMVFALMSGCRAVGHLYPVQGPLMNQPEVPVFIATVTGLLDSGTITATLSNGEFFKGRWEAVQAMPISQNPGSADSTASGNLASVWDTIYGQGYYVAHVLGSHWFDRAIITGNRGTILTVEMLREIREREHEAPVTAGGKGVARDSKGNIYKLAF
jgi:hypothetical protein